MLWPPHCGGLCRRYNRPYSDAASLRRGLLPVLSADVGHDVLVEELEDEGDTVGEHQVLRDDLKLQGDVSASQTGVCV